MHAQQPMLRIAVPLAEVGAGAEGAPGAAQDQGAAVVVADRLEKTFELVQHVVVDGVQHLWPVQGQYRAESAPFDVHHAHAVVSVFACAANVPAPGATIGEFARLA
jgi:hypothetical protein